MVADSYVGSLIVYSTVVKKQTNKLKQTNKQTKKPKTISRR